MRRALAARSITEQLNAVYGPGGVDSRLDPGLRAAALKTLTRAPTMQ